MKKSCSIISKAKVTDNQCKIEDSKFFEALNSVYKKSW